MICRVECYIRTTPEKLWQALTDPEFTRQYWGETWQECTWKPGYVERDWSEGAPPVSTEITIATRSDGQCIARMVHSVYSTSDRWDDQLEAFESGWPGFFEVLRVYLSRFAGEAATSFSLSASRPGGDLELWSRMTAALNLAGANVGERRETPAGAPNLAGVVERVHQDSKGRDVMVRFNHPGDGMALIGSHASDQEGRVAISMYFYGANAAESASAEKEKWEAWVSSQLRD